MIGVAPLGVAPLGALEYEPVVPTVAPSQIPIGSARAVIVGAAFQAILRAPRARREYLVTIKAVELA